MATDQAIFAPADTVIEARGLVRRYCAVRALDGVDLAVAAGGVTAILGANGAGKTTFVECALGLVRPSGGTMRVFGARPGRMRVRRRIGAMLQDADLPDLLSPREHLTLFASYYPVPLKIDEIIDLCALEPFLDKAYGKLSGGQKRRTQFAIALIGAPDLLFLDEPTTGLDPEARRITWRIVAAQAERGKTVILTTHYLEEADQLADRIVVMHQGRVIADAPTTEIREAVGDALIRCITSLPAGRLRDLAGVKSVRRDSRFTELLSDDAAATLRALLDLDPDLAELTVRKPSLEEAFLDLIAPSGEKGERAS